MESEVKMGIDKFRKACEVRLPGIQIVVPVRPTGANFLVSLTHEGERTYITIHEDDFADWGESSDDRSVEKAAEAAIQKLLSDSPNQKS